MSWRQVHGEKGGREGHGSQRKRKERQKGRAQLKGGGKTRGGCKMERETEGLGINRRGPARWASDDR